jgi:uncharacterized protein
MHQKWRELLFLHWEVPPAALKALLPPGLELDLWEGRAFVGLIPFVVSETRARFLPPLPGLSSYNEINTRTYVQHGAGTGGESGVWFFALDASNIGVTAGARATFQLPYYPCTAQRRHSDQDGSVVRYRSARLAPGPTPGDLDVEYRVHELIGTAQPGTLDHYFIERYTLFTVMRPVGLMVGQVRHQPYPLRRVELLRLDCETLARSLKLPPPTGDVHALYSDGVDVDIMAPRGPRGHAAPESLR